jgi:hypothetical protein
MYRKRGLEGFKMEVRVTEVNASDELTIRTLFSDYTFRVTDPVQRRGLLSGGRLGDQQHEAFFAGAILPPSGQAASQSSRVETGYRAIFVIVGDCLVRLTTSIITEITLSQKAAEGC